MKRRRGNALWLAVLLLLFLVLSACGGEEDPRAGGTRGDESGHSSLTEEIPDPSPSVSIYAATGLDNPDVKKNGYLPEYFCLTDGFMTYTGPGVKNYIGIDVSAHQGEIDWVQVAQAGVSFAMIRVGYRGYETGNLNLDQYFEANVEGALAAGLRVGIYFFSQATNVAEAREEAAQVMEWIAPYEITYPVVFDWEPVQNDAARTNGVDAETVTECAKAFCMLLETEGYIPAVYSNKNQAYDVMNLAELSKYDFWLAEYTETPGFRYHFEMWQYSCTGTVPGVSTPVDLNLCLVEYPMEENDAATQPQTE